MRRLFTTEDAKARGLTMAALRWGEQTGRWRRIERGVYGEGPDDPSPLDRALAALVLTGGMASGRLAGVLHELDAVTLSGPSLTLPANQNGRRAGMSRREVAAERVIEVDGIRCTDGLQTLVDLAAALSDATWEQALESAIRKRLASVSRVKAELPELSRSRTPGTARVRRVLALRPAGAPPTESLLETLMAQLARRVRGVPDPTRQLRIEEADGRFVARVDLAWPALGLFVELDGQHHKGQPVYDASRETAVVAATGWLCGRFTWTEVVRYPTSTARRLAQLAAQARRRPVSCA